MTELADHPVAALFPLATDDDVGKLAQDIQEHGLIEPIDIFEGKILDGRNRYRACVRAGVEPATTPWEQNGKSPLEYVISKNLHRRHLTVAQRAALGVKILPLLEEEARQRMVEGGKRGKPSSKGETNSSHLIDRVRQTPQSRKQAADLVSVGETSISAAKLIAKRSPKTLRKMERGEISVNAAAVEAGVATGTYTKKKKGAKRKRVVGATPANNIHQAAFATGLAFNVRAVFGLIPRKQLPELISHAEHAMTQWTAIVESLREEKEKAR